MHLWSTAGYILKPHLSNTIESYMEKIQQCCIRGKLHPWKIQAAMVTERCFNPSILKSFFFSEIFFEICRGSQAMANFGGLPLVINIAQVRKKQLSFCQFKCLDVDLRKVDNVRANSRKYLTH